MGIDYERMKNGQTGAALNNLLSAALNDAKNMREENAKIQKRLAEAEKKISEWEAAPDWVQAGDGTLHGAIDYWQERASKAEQRLVDLEEELDELDKELFIFAHDVMCFENDKMPDWVFEKAKAIYGRLCLGKGE